MSLKPWSAFFNDVLPHVPGCTEPVAQNEILNAAIEFCDRSWGWTGFHDTLSVTATVGDVEFEPPDGRKVVIVLEGWFSGCHLPYRAPGDLEREFGGDWTTKTGTPCVCTQLNTAEVRLVPIPVAGAPNSLRMRVAWKPTSDATGIGAEFFEEHRVHIAAGALAKLLTMQKKPWTNKDDGGLKLAEFESAIDRTKGKVLRGFGRSRTRVKAHFL